MPVAGFALCARAAREAGQKKKEALYRKKALEAASAISKNFENWLSEFVLHPIFLFRYSKIVYDSGFFLHTFVYNFR